MNDFCVEVKVCEGCGALFLRARGLGAVGRGTYCRGCSVWLSEFPAPIAGYGQVSREERARKQRDRRRRNRARKALKLVECVGGAR